MKYVRRIAVAAVALIVLGAIGLVCQRVAARGRYVVAYSSYGAGPDGARGVFLLAERLGLRPVRWAEDVARLPSQGMLVALGGCEVVQNREVTRYEQEILVRWVEAGGVLVVAGAQDYLPSKLGVTIDRRPGECDPRVGIVGMLAEAERAERARQAGRDAGPTEIEALPGDFVADPDQTYDEVTETEALPPAQWAWAASDTLRGLGGIAVRGPATIKVHDGVASDAVLMLPDGPAAVVVRRGRGAVVALASASMFQNRDLHAGEGGVLFARLVRLYAPRGPVMFDEYHLGVGERRSLMRYLGQVGFGPVAVQVLIIVMFALWRLGTRWGGTRREAPPQPAGTASYVAAIGMLYAKSKDPAEAVAILVRHALNRVAAHHRLPSAEPEHLAKELDERKRVEEAKAVRELGAMPYAARATSAAQLVDKARAIDDAVTRATREVI